MRKEIIYEKSKNQYSNTYVGANEYHRGDEAGYGLCGW